jgi:CRP-like cAMP-binding protein
MYSTDILYAGAVHRHRANKLLAALEPEDFACLEPHLEIVSLRHGQVLCEAGQPLHYAFFPHNVIISLMAVMHEVISTRPNIQRLMRHFMEALMSRVLQNVACNAIHSVEARCARLILSTSHQVEQETIPLTHEFWADRMGVQRSTVSAIMKKFQAAGLVRQSRGGIAITDPTALREVSCECYQTVHDVFVRLPPYTAKKD